MCCPYLVELRPSWNIDLCSNGSRLEKTKMKRAALKWNEDNVLEQMFYFLSLYGFDEQSVDSIYRNLFPQLNEL